jgi:hypothetical protein
MKSSDRKSMAVLDALSYEQQEIAFEYCSRSSTTLAKGVKWLFSEFGITSPVKSGSPIDPSSLSDWLAKKRDEQLLLRTFTRAIQKCERDGKPTRFEINISDVIQQAIFEEMLNPPGDRDTKTLTRLLDHALCAKERFRDSQGNDTLAIIARINPILAALTKEIQGNEIALKRVEELRKAINR